MPKHKSLIIAGLAALGLVTAVPAEATEPTINIGTLTCTVEPLPAGAKKRTRDISCVFQPRAGPRASYIGRLTLVAGAPLLDANRVLIWTVLAPRRVQVHSIGGRYLTSLSAKPVPSAKRAGGLFRQSETPIELRAQTHTASGGAKAGRKLAIELELHAAKA